MTDKQKKLIQYHFMNHGIKGDKIPWDKLDSFLASGVIDKLLNSGIFHAMKELEPHGFSFTDEDWEIARQ